MDDPYLDIIDEQWDHILRVYEQSRDKKPIIEYDLQDMKIYSYPAMEYINKLSSRTRTQMKGQYEEVTPHSLYFFVVFVIYNYPYCIEL